MSNAHSDLDASRIGHPSSCNSQNDRANEGFTQTPTNFNQPSSTPDFSGWNNTQHNIAEPVSTILESSDSQTSASDPSRDEVGNNASEYHHSIASLSHSSTPPGENQQHLPLTTLLHNSRSTSHHFNAAFAGKD